MDLNNSSEVEDYTLANSDVITKYINAAEIVNEALNKVISHVSDGASIYELCLIGDKHILEATSKVYNKKVKGKAVSKGIAFPTCVSTNEICGHSSPTSETTKIANGDLVKIELGCHIDGYICVVAHSLIVGDSNPKAQLALKSAWVAYEAGTRKIKIGNSSSQVTKTISEASSLFKCTPLRGIFSHELKKNTIHGNRCFPNSERGDSRTEEFTFGPNEVYSLDVLVSTGDGKGRDTDYKTTVYRREPQNNYTLKTTLGRAFISEVNQKAPFMPFSLRSIDDERAMLVGLPEALRHGLIQPYPILSEKPGEFVAHFKCTILLLPNGSKRITGIKNPNEESIKSDPVLADTEILKLINTPLNVKKKASKEVVAAKTEG